LCQHFEQVLDRIGEEEVVGLWEQVVVDTLKALFNVTIFLGPLEVPPNPEPTERERTCWRKLVPHFQRFMALDASHHKLKQFCVSCLINTPLGCAEYFDLGTGTLDTLIAFLSEQLAIEEVNEEYKPQWPTIAINDLRSSDLKTLARLVHS
jgi:hypothetical protein